MMLDLKHIFDKYGIMPNGVLHLGASEGQERGFYNSLGVKKVIWVEAIPEVYEKLKENVKPFPNQIAINFCVSNEDDKEVEFNISNNEAQSSSMLDFGTHSSIHPEVHFVDKIKLRTWRLDTLFRLLDINITMLDFLNVDLQGAELMALEGMGKYLDQFKSINIEVNRVEVYKGCPLIEDIDYFLLQHDFERVELGNWVAESWSDAFYMKRK